MKPVLRWLAPAVALAGSSLAGAHDVPLQPLPSAGAAASPPRIGLTYESAFSDYPRWREQQRGDWPALNRALLEPLPRAGTDDGRVRRHDEAGHQGGRGLVDPGHRAEPPLPANHGGHANHGNQGNHGGHAKHGNHESHESHESHRRNQGSRDDAGRATDPSGHRGHGQHGEGR